MARDFSKVRQHVSKTAKRMFDTFEKRREALLETCYEFYPLGVPGLKLGVEELADGFEFDEDHRMLTLMPLMMLRKSAAGFNSNLTSPARSWFELQLPDNMANGEASHEQLKALDALKQAAEKTLAGSNAYTQIYKLYEHLLCVGFGCMLISEDPAQVIHCQTLRIGTYALDIDEKGRVCRVARRFAWTPQHILDEFGEEWTPDDIKEQCKRGSTRRIEVWNLIEPNPQGFSRNFDPLEKDGAGFVDESFAFRSFYMLRRGCSGTDRTERHGVLRLAGYAHNPIIAPRLDYENGDIYGIGRCMELVYNARGAQTFKGDELRISGMRAEPPVVAGSDFRDNIKLGRGGVNITESGDQRTGQVTSIFTQLPDASDTRLCLEESKNEIMEALYVDAFAVIDSQKNNPGVKTATEVEYLKTENLSKLGSIAVELNLEMLDPLVRTVTEYAFDAKVQPLTDDDMATLLDGSTVDEQSGAVLSTEGAVINAVKIEYVSQIALAQKAGALTSVQSYVAFCGNLAALNPNAADNPVENIDRDKTARMFGRMLGVPEEVNRDPKDVERQRASTAAAMAQQAQMQQIAQTVDAAKEIGSIPVDDAHAGGIVKGLM